jgi:hypothetical protein
LRVDLFQNATNDVAFALYGTNDRRFGVVVALFLIPMTVDVFSADPRFVYLDNAAKLLLRLDHCCADFVTHQMRGVVRAEPELPLNLERADTLLAGCHEVHDLEPVAQRLVRVFKNRACEDRKAIAGIAARSALRALPVPFTGVQIIDSGIAAAGTDDALRPTAGPQVSLGRIVLTEWEYCLKFPLRHLVNWLRTFCHGSYPRTSTVGEAMSSTA